MVLGKSEYADLEPKAKFLFPVDELIGKDFRLVPFEIDKHATAYWDGTGPGPELYAYMRMGPFACKADFIDEIPAAAENNPATQLYAVITTRRSKHDTEGQTLDRDQLFAGITAFCEASKSNLKIEIGPIILLPQYHGTGLGRAVVELMIQHCFKDPLEGGWGIRRISWTAHAANTSSIKLAERLKFEREGVVKWDMVFRDGAAKGKVGNGRPLPPPANSRDIGRDTVLFGRSWDD